MNEGWIKIHRKLLKWEWYDDTNMVRLFLHLLLMANYKPLNWRGNRIPRGGLVTSRGKLSEQTGLSEREVRTCLKRLKSTQEITISTTSMFTIIIFNKYDSYQSDDSSDVQVDNRQSTDNQPSPDQQATNERPTKDQRATTSKEYKEYKEIKNERKREGERDVAPSPEDKGLFDFSQENVRDLMRFMSFADDS